MSDSEYDVVTSVKAISLGIGEDFFDRESGGLKNPPPGSATSGAPQIPSAPHSEESSSVSVQEVEKTGGSSQGYKDLVGAYPKKREDIANASSSLEQLKDDSKSLDVIDTQTVSLDRNTKTWSLGQLIAKLKPSMRSTSPENEQFKSETNPLGVVCRNERLAREKVISRDEEIMTEIVQLRKDVANGLKEEDEVHAILMERQKEKDGLCAIWKAAKKEKDEFLAEFWKSEHNFGNECLKEYPLLSFDKPLRLHENLALIMESSKAEQTGGDYLPGYMVWDSAEILAQFLEIACANYIKGKKILELGAGTGYVGIVAALLGGDVVVSDLPQMIPFIQKNIDANSELLEETGGKIRTHAIRWGEVEDIEDLPLPDIILVSDLIYREELNDKLISTLLALSNERSKVFIFQDQFAGKLTRQDAWDHFYRQVTKYFRLTEVPIRLNKVKPNGGIDYDDGGFWTYEAELRHKGLSCQKKALNNK